GQQRGRMIKTGCVEIAGAAPHPCGWIVQLRAVEVSVAIVAASRNQHLAVFEQGCCVPSAGGVEIARIAPTRSSRLCRGESCRPCHEGDATQQTDQCQDQTNVMASVVLYLD